MDKLQEIKESMNQMPLKKVWFGGYSKEDVQLKMDMLYAMVEKAMKEQAEKEAELLAGFENQIKAMQEEFDNQKRVSDILIGDLNKNINNLTAQNTMMEHAEEALEEEKQQLLLEQAQMKEANDMLVAENEQRIKEQAQMKEAYRAYCGELLKEYSDSLRALSGEFSRILENVSNMQKEIDAESVFEGLEKAFEMKKREVLTGTVEESIEAEV